MWHFKFFSLNVQHQNCTSSNAVLDEEEFSPKRVILVEIKQLKERKLLGGGKTDRGEDQSGVPKWKQRGGQVLFTKEEKKF